MGFAIYAVGSLLLYLTPSKGDTGALELIIFRPVQAAEGAFLFANSAAILTDAFPTMERGKALGINQAALLAGSRRVQRVALGISIVWGLVVWVFGERMSWIPSGTMSSGVFPGTPSMMNGFIGAALVYVLIAILLLFLLVRHWNLSWRFSVVRNAPIVLFLISAAVQAAPLMWTTFGLASFLYGTISSLYGAVVAAMIYFAFIGLAAVLYGIRREKNQSSRLVLAVVGGLQMVVFSYLIYEFFAYSQVWGGNPLAYGYIVATFVGGSLIYFISKKWHAKRGIDISMAFKEIPPD